MSLYIARGVLSLRIAYSLSGIDTVCDSPNSYFGCVILYDSVFTVSLCWRCFDSVWYKCLHCESPLLGLGCRQEMSV
jgi:hypothetical protein